jgi:hypothetical protein
MTERERFEEWMVANGFDVNRNERNQEKYLTQLANHMWLAWVARARLEDARKK